MAYRYESLAAQIRTAIEQGTYRPGERLPGLRRLSRRHGVSMATALAAYRSLEDAAYIEARSRSGYYVRARAGLAEPTMSSPPSRPMPVSGQELVLRLVQAANEPNVVQLGAAVPDSRYLPVVALERAMTRAARRYRQRGSEYMFPPGLPELRRQIAQRLVETGCRVGPDELVITNGCQEALTLALRAVTAPGDIVAIESPCFYGLLQVIESLGLRAIEVPTHPREGIALDALEQIIARWPVRACVVVPNYSNPLGYCMSDTNKQALVSLLARHAIALIEDDVYGDLGFSGQRPPAAKAWDRDGNVLYCASYSKSLSPGLRLGWIAPGRYQAQVEYLKYVSNLAAPTLAQLALAEYLEHDGYDRYLRRVRGEYARAVSRMIDAVGRHFPAGTRVTQPEGGFVIWVELPEEVDTMALAHRALAAGISIAPGPIFSATQKYRRFLRLSCACVWDERIERALAKIVRLL